MSEKFITLKSGLIVKLDSIDAIQPKKEKNRYCEMYEIVGYVLFVNGSDIEITTSEFNELKEHL